MLSNLEQFEILVSIAHLVIEKEVRIHILVDVYTR